jgi:hypothetical protein
MAASRSEVRAPRDSARSASLTVTVGARRGQPVGVQAQRVQRGQMGVDRVRLAPPPLAPTGTFDLYHGQSRGLQHPGQSDSVAAGALEPDHHPRPGCMLGDPADRFGIAALVVANHQRGDGRPNGPVAPGR